MDDILQDYEFVKNPVERIKQTKQFGKYVYALYEACSGAKGAEQLLPHESIQKHKGDCVILITGDNKRFAHRKPMYGWLLKTEDIGQAIVAFGDCKKYYAQKVDYYSIFHITDDNIGGYATIGRSTMLHFIAAMPRVNWIEGMEHYLYPF